MQDICKGKRDVAVEPFYWTATIGLWQNGDGKPNLVVIGSAEKARELIEAIKVSAAELGWVME